MLKQIIGVGLAVIVSPALAQEPADSALFEQGQQLYEANCALCHGNDGLGDPPVFPALNGNAELEDLALIVTTIHEGRGAMPPFPEFEAAELAPLATYIRNAWDNDFGAAAEDEVASIVSGLGEAGEQATIWDGVYTEEQAARGQTAYAGPCGLCHGRRLNGAPDDPDMRSSPPLARAPFLREWDGRSLATLFEYTRSTMPLNNPGFLTDQQYVDIIAHMLAMSNMPAGEEELPIETQSLANIVIRQEEP